jgi:gliding motility-associated-like protein
MNYSRLLIRLCLSCLAFIPVYSYSQLTVNPNQTATVLANKLAGTGIAITSPVLTCIGVATGTFVSTSTPITIDSGILLTSGKAINVIGPEPILASTSNGTPGDPSLTALAMATTYDACALEFDFYANGDTVSFNFQFGSEEYINSTCGPYNDAFAFFISGPGIVGSQNMALVPGTNIPITVNSVNSGVPGTGYSLANCTAMGPGSPFTAYYYDNTGGTQLTYKGFTRKMKAFHSVTPCNTYHLKIAICDAGNRLYDSGVFIEAGSLKTNTYSFDHSDSIGSTINGVPHTIVKGCSPATVKIRCDHPTGTAHTVHFQFGGTAIHGTDFTSPDSATIVAGADSVVINVAGIPTPPGGTKTLMLYLLSPFSCGIVDSVLINIMDTPSAHILTTDTTICSGSSFQIRVSGTAGLTYNWSPATGLSSVTAMQPIATPSVTTTYVLTAALPGSGCPAIIRSITVNVTNTDFTILTPNTSLCAGSSLNINVSGDPSLVYSWSPATGLSNPNIQNPVATPTVTTTYTLTVTAPGGACPKTATITITLGSVNVTMLTTDTTICKGDYFTMRVLGNTDPSYNWTPSAGLSSSTLMQPVVGPTVTTIYTLTASFPGCVDFVGHILVTVIDASIILSPSDTTICTGESMNIRLYGNPSLVYNWNPPAGLSDPFIKEPVATPSATTIYTVTATSAGGECTSKAQLRITVGNPMASILTNDTSICKGASLTLLAIGDSSLVYSWTPSTGLTDPNTQQPIAAPGATTTYTLKAWYPGAPCFVTDKVTVSVQTATIENVTTSQTIKYGSSVQLNADASLYYMWTPNDGSLNNPNINNPIATPLVPTTYTVLALDKNGCKASASVNIDLEYDNIFIPDAFTPNQDGLNDVFRITNLGYYKLVEMSVFNRWGNLVYHSADGQNKGWDGTFNGQQQDLGVYNYLIIISDPKGINHSYKGSVTIIR